MVTSDSGAFAFCGPSDFLDLHMNYIETYRRQELKTVSASGKDPRTGVTLPAAPNDVPMWPW